MKLSAAQQKVIDALNSHPLAFLYTRHGSKFHVVFGELGNIGYGTVEVLRKEGLIVRGMLSPEQRDAYAKLRVLRNHEHAPRDALQLIDRVYKEPAAVVEARKAKQEIDDKVYNLSVASESIREALATAREWTEWGMECVAPLEAFRDRLENAKAELKGEK